MLALFIIAWYNKHMSSNNAQTEIATGKYRKTRLDRSSKNGTFNNEATFRVRRIKT